MRNGNYPTFFLAALLPGLGAPLARGQYCAEPEYSDCVGGCSGACGDSCGAAQTTCEGVCDATYETCDAGCDVCCFAGCSDQECSDCRTTCSDTQTSCRSGCQLQCSNCRAPCEDSCEFVLCDYPPVCNAGGPYYVACQESEPLVRLDGSQCSDDHGLADGLQLWTTDCPGADFTSNGSLLSVFSIDPDECTPTQCGATLQITDGHFTASCDAGVFYVLGMAIFVNYENAPPAPADGTVELPYPTVTQGVNAASSSGTTVLFMRWGDYPESVTINKDIWIAPYGDGGLPVTIGD